MYFFAYELRTIFVYYITLEMRLLCSKYSTSTLHISKNTLYVLRFNFLIQKFAAQQLTCRAHASVKKKQLTPKTMRTPRLDKALAREKTVVERCPRGRASMAILLWRLWDSRLIFESRRPPVGADEDSGICSLDVSWFEDRVSSPTTAIVGYVKIDIRNRTDRRILAIPIL